jgi:coenzyme F420-0:L-glutamate ligase/coenzyme F420-1:gamma-L-glutamate ligase
MAKPLVLTPLQDLPLIQPGDNLSDLLWQSIASGGISLLNGDILVIAQKIVSKAEGRLVNLTTVFPSPQAIQLAKKVDKDPRFVELVLQESRSVLRTRPGTLIVEHCLGFVCANAGVDHSNVSGQSGNPEDWYLLLPKNPDQSAASIRKDVELLSGARIGVAIIDSHGRAWRMGIVGTTIGLSGLPGLVDMRGKPDMFGYALRVTQIAAVDELAAAASLVMGQANERCPAVHVRGFPYELRESSFTELIRPESEDLFR